MLRKLRSISDFFGKFPSIGYLFLYLLAIPFFASIYTYSIPSDFYHTTVQFEGILNKDANKLSLLIKQSIVDEFRIFHKSDKSSNGTWQIDVSKIDVVSLKTDTDKTSFSIVIRLDVVGHSPDEVLFQLECSIENNSNKITVTSDDKRISYLHNASSRDISNFNDGKYTIYKQPKCKSIRPSFSPIDLKVLFPASFSESDRSTSLWLPVNQNVQMKIYSFVDAMNGFSIKCIRSIFSDAIFQCSDNYNFRFW